MNTLKGVILMMLLASCASGAPPPEGVVKVQNDTGGYGTGFFVTRNVVATCQHIVKGADEIFIRYHDGRWTGAQLIAEHPEEDLVLLLVDYDSRDPLPLSTVDELDFGDTLETWGFPKNHHVGNEVPTYARGYVMLPATETETDEIQAHLPTAAGSSGSPVLKNGVVVGVTRSILRGYPYLTFLIPVEHLRDLLDNLEK